MYYFFSLAQAFLTHAVNFRSIILGSSPKLTSVIPLNIFKEKKNMKVGMIHFEEKKYESGMILVISYISRN